MDCTNESNKDLLQLFTTFINSITLSFNTCQYFTVIIRAAFITCSHEMLRGIDEDISMAEHSS